MSPEALQAVLDAVEAELDHARDWQRTAAENARQADELAGKAQQQLQDARQRLAALQDAHAYLQGLQGLQGAAEAPEDGAA